MNILFIAHEKELNGATLSLLGMIDEMKDMHNVYVLSPYKEGEFVEELKKRNINVVYRKYSKWMIYKSNNIIIWYIKRVLCLLRCQINYISAFSLIKLLKDEKIDIIHTNTSVINIGAILHKMTDIPHIFHIREFGQEDFNLYPIYSKKFTLNYINSNSNNVIAVSKAIHNKYAKYLDKNKIKVVYNGVSDKNINTKSFCYEKKEMNLLICGAVTEAKGQKQAILAINEIVKRGYEDIKLYIAGSGEVETLKNLIIELELNDNIKILGRVNNVKELRKNIDIELVCSRSEAFGRVTIEAMMGMIPVVGSNTGGTKELIEENETGLLYEQGNFVDLADKIEIFLKDRNKIEYMGKNAYNYAKQFKTEINSRKILDIYKENI